jgi:PPOX class probable F420-dependent enzyme
MSAPDRLVLNGGLVAKQLTDDQRRLLREPNLASLATMDDDGRPHVTPVWVDEEDGRIVVNTADGRAKVRHLRREPRVGILVMDREDPYTWVSIRGRVVEITTDGAHDHIDELSRRYEGKAFDHPPGQVRLKVLIEPDQVTEYR